MATMTAQPAAPGVTRAVPRPRCMACGQIMDLQRRNVNCWTWRCPVCEKVVLDYAFVTRAQPCPPGMSARELRLAQCVPI